MAKVISINKGSNTPLSKQQADVLFNRECIFVGKGNVITETRLRQLFGDSAVDYAVNHGEGGKWWNVWGSVRYLYYEGYLQAVSQHNIELYLSEVDSIDTDTR